MNKETINRIFNALLLIIILIMMVRMCNIQKDAINETTALKKSIIASDKLTKEAEGQYAKLVDYYKTERDLINDIKENNIELYKTIKKQDERLLSITNAVITLDTKVVQGFAQVDPVDTNNLNLSLKYPDEKEPFIFWDGFVNKNTAAYRGTFSFGKLPIKVILTEESRGLWKSRIVGPEWLKVDSMSILSIAPEEYTTVKPKNLQWLVGGSYYYGLNSNDNAVGLNLGVNLFDRHNILIGANTRQQVSFGYMYKIKSFKRTK
jgi:hypothetical protein